MKIAHVVDYYYPELGYQISYITRYMRRMGHDVFVVTSERYSKVIYEKDAMKKLLGDRINIPGVNIDDNGIVIKRLKVNFEVGSTLWLDKLEETLLSIDPDIIYVHGITTISGIRCAFSKGRFHNLKLVYQSYQVSAGSFSSMRFLYIPFRFIFSPLILNKADIFIAIADEAKEFANKKIGIPLERIEAVSHGADPSIFYRDLRIRENYRKKYNINSNDVVYIYTGKILPYKGVHLLVNAGIKLMHKYSNIKILIIGGGGADYLISLKDIANNSNYGNNFIFIDAVPHKELYKYYSVADVAVWPSSVTISSLEAMSCSLPVIVSDVPAAMERVRYENGFVVCGDCEIQLCSYMEKLFCNENLRLKMGMNGRTIILNELNWDKICKKILKYISK